MPALIAVIVLAALLKLFPSVALLASGLWFFGVLEVIEVTCRAFSTCQPGYFPLWALWAGLLPISLPAIYFALKYWFSGRRLHLNLLIFTVGVPAAIIFTIATSGPTFWDQQ